MPLEIWTRCKRVAIRLLATLIRRRMDRIRYAAAHDILLDMLFAFGME